MHDQYLCVLFVPNFQGERTERAVHVRTLIDDLERADRVMPDDLGVPRLPAVGWFSRWLIGFTVSLNDAMTAASLAHSRWRRCGSDAILSALINW